MIRYIFTSLLSFLVLILSSQDSQKEWDIQTAYTDSLIPPNEARYSNEHLPYQIDLMWSPPAGWVHSAVDHWFEYDRGVFDDGLGSGFISGEVAIRLDTAQLNMYDTVYLTKIKYYMIQPLVHYSLRAYNVDSTDFDTLLNHPLLLNPVYNTVDTLNLLTPIQINTSEELWITMYVDSMAPAFPIPVGGGPEINNYGNLIKVGDNGEWTTLTSFNPDLRFNWFIAGYLETPNDTIIYPLFNIYRAIDDGPFEKLNEEAYLDTIYYDYIRDIEASHIYYYVTSQYEFGESLPSNIVDVSFVNIPEEKVNNIHVYPNPTSGRIIIKSGKGPISSISLLNNQGSIILRKTASSKTVTLDISHLSNALYFLKVMINDEIFTSKVMKVTGDE